MDITFGPVPSRRLGRSLGINNIPPKICSYACIYCQVGKTLKMQIERKKFFEAEDILNSVSKRLREVRKRGESIDFLTFVSDGEPTLDVELGRSIEALKTFQIPIAVISNGTLIDRKEVQNDLYKADWVSFKVDAAEETVWRKINRPHRKLDLAKMMEGMLVFREHLSGILATETMLIKGVNDSQEAIEDITAFLVRLKPDFAYISIPTRPPADESVVAADSVAVERARDMFADQLNRVEVLSGYESNTFTYTGDIRQDILNITAVHPMHKEAVLKILQKAGADWDTVEEMLQNKELKKTEYNGHLFFLRSF
ncbi:MAG TPA: radical SAM protein [Caldithrix abyssi]|uniref:Radical SAM protein n=1 Tax=Caldithrix abyssi TaxID=187145 RepID=A0A7V4TY50_CALAY|nr:radical SAM protein [Caldithrix abyssi]